MNERERFIATLTGGRPDRPSYGDYLYYESTRKRWEAEGMPAGVDLWRHFGFDHIDIWFTDRVPCGGFSARFERVLLEDTVNYQVWRETDGPGILSYYFDAFEDAQWVVFSDGEDIWKVFHDGVAMEKVIND